MARKEFYPTTKTGSGGALGDHTGTAETGDKVAADVSVRSIAAGVTVTATGTFTPTGLFTAIKVTTVDIPDTATPLPLVPLVGRNSLVLTNKDGVEILYIGPSTVTADNVLGVTSGHEVNAGESFSLDIQDDIVLYARAPAGKTIRVKIMELA